MTGGETLFSVIFFGQILQSKVVIGPNQIFVELQNTLRDASTTKMGQNFGLLTLTIGVLLREL